MLEGSHINREREIFLEALEQPSTEARAAFIERATAGDPKLREAVEELLLEHNQEDTFLVHGAGGRLRESMESAGKLLLHEEQIGDFIGRYKLLEKIGEGGFGVVYRAEQSEPIRRHVALKVIKLGMDTKSIVARFEAERQALALMDHPSIARVLDGGATITGRPYFVMELVRGVRITEYCEANSMRLEERLTLFIQLCHAIQHAHQKSVIHRDLKPSNVLVTVQDGKPVPKVIDFGIAKAIEEPLTEKTVLTNFHSFIGTPAYTSPEQAEMTGSDVDTRSDIYSLGVLLYELLTGVTPFDAKELTQSGLDGMRRVIKEVEPSKPSTRLRRTLPGKPATQETVLVDRDLDWIVMKCLEKDRTRRYSTAQELAADLQSKHRTEGLQRFEWRYLWHAAQGDDHRLFTQEASSVLSLANSAEWLAVGLRDSVRIYDARKPAAW
jgi:serine/threonine protein kinase